MPQLNLKIQSLPYDYLHQQVHESVHMYLLLFLSFFFSKQHDGEEMHISDVQMDNLKKKKSDGKSTHRVNPWNKNESTSKNSVEAAVNNTEQWAERIRLMVQES